MYAAFPWLYSVLGFSILTFILEYLVSQYAHSDALRADCGHLFVDIFMYAQVIIAEHFKNMNFVKKNPRWVALLDLCAGVFVFALLVVNSSFVLQNATKRLDGHTPNVSKEPPPPPGLLSWVWASFFHDHDHHDVNEKLVFAFCAGSLPFSIAIAWFGYSHVSTNTDSWIDTMHNIVHPGCNGFHTHETGGEGLTSAFGKPCRQNDDCADCMGRNSRALLDGPGGLTRRPSFNLVTVWVHITTDILKDLALLASAFIMIVIPQGLNKNSVDAVTSMVVVGLIAIGTVWTLPAICNTVRIVIWGADPRPEDEGRDEESSLLINGAANTQEQYGVSS